MAQVQTCLLVTGRSWWDYVSFCAGLPLFTKRVEPEQKWRDAIISAATSAEHSIGQMVAQYARAAEGLPDTEHVPNDLDLVI
jgi:hypothetical protein